MSVHSLLLLLLAFFFVPIFLQIPPSSAESPACLAAYEEGGAPAVFLSPQCPRWNLTDGDHRHPPSNCQISIIQGRRRSLEDRAVCAPNIRIPFHGSAGVKEVSVSIVAVFDGHGGAEVSDIASKLLLKYFGLHASFILDGIYSAVLKRSPVRLNNAAEQDLMSNVLSLYKGHWSNLDPERFNWALPTIFDDAFRTVILKESLLRTIHDIAATITEEASRKNLKAGSTATIALIVDGQILAANIGDSKTFLCSKKFPPVDCRKDNKYVNSRLTGSDGRAFYAKELTKDHHPDRDDERNRIEAAGGYVLWVGVHRVNGQLAVSRALGDLPFKKYGVISTPEVTDWQSLTSNDSYLVAASDGIFESMTTQEVCDLLWDEKMRTSTKPDFDSATTHSLADSIIKSAYEGGSTDNIAVVVLPLVQQLMHENPANDVISASLLPVDDLISKLSWISDETGEL